MNKVKIVQSCLCFLFLNVHSYAQDSADSLDDLLSQYRSDSDLSNQTKKESAGSLIVYTRDRLERMHAYNLRDILKTIPIFTMQEASTGQVSLSKAKGSTFNSQFLKLYINDHEVGSVAFGSAMKMWGYLDITYIDHIEVYQVGSSVMAGDEPPGIVVRLYAKDPKRDAGSAVQVIGGSRDSSELSAYYAYKGEKYSSLVYADVHNENRKPYTSARSSVDVDRDFQTTNFFASLNGEDFTIDVAQFRLEQDRFFGAGKLHTPLENNSDMIHRYIVGTHYFQDKTLKLKLAYDNAHHDQSESDPNGILLYNADGTKSTVTNWSFNKSESILDAVIDKQFLLDHHDIHAGIQTKYKSVDPHSIKANGIERVHEVAGPTHWVTYSVFVSDDITLNEHNLLFANLKIDHYDRNGGADDFTDYVLRLGHIYNDGKWMWKSFAARTYGYPAFMQSTYFPYYSKTDIALKAEERMAASTEIAYKTDNSDTSLRLIYNTAKDAIVLQNNMYVNTTSKPDFYAIYAGHDLRFTRDHRLHFSAYYGTDDMPLTQSSTTGALIQLFNTFGKIDLYNEIVYRNGYTYSTPTGITVDVKAGYDYSAGITYRMTKDFTLFVKGENILNKAIKTPYPMPTYIDYTAPFDRTFRTGLKYVF